jgi:hypothetical protein
MAFRNEAYEVQNLINIYRANPNMFDSDQLDVLQNKANQYGINFKPLKDTTTLSSLAKNFAGGFVRGMVPFVPPDEQPRTTYDAIAQSYICRWCISRWCVWWYRKLESYRQ